MSSSLQAPPGSLPTDVRFYGAKILDEQLKRRWAALPEKESVKDSLFALVVKELNGEPIVLTKLSVAISTLATRAVPEFWTDVVSDIVGVFSNAGQSGAVEPGAATTAMLRLLTFLPEEYGTAAMESGVRQALSGELKEGLPSLLELVLGVMKSVESEGHTPMVEAGLKCFTAW